MSSNISNRSGQNETFTAVHPAWHGLGKTLDHIATAKEALEAANLGWEVKIESIALQKDQKVIPNRLAIVRQDSRDVFGFVTERYKPIQNVDLAGFGDVLVGQGQAVFESAGALGNGERVWFLMNVPGDIVINRQKDDITRKYILITNFHDGKHSMKAFFTPVRVVCANTLAMAFSGIDKKEGITIRHTGEMKFKVAEAQRILGLAVKYYDNMSEVFNTLAEKQVTTVRVDEFLKELVPDNKDAKRNTRTDNVRNEMKRLFESGKGNTLPGVRGTAWALVNGVSDYITHNISVHGETDIQKQENRLKTSRFGKGQELNMRAIDLAMKL